MRHHKIKKKLANNNSCGAVFIFLCKDIIKRNLAVCPFYPFGENGVSVF